MAGNTIGKILTLTTFGESHGKGIGGIIDGLPAGLKVDVEFVQNELNRRRPGQSSIATKRNEPDIVEFLSGIKDDFTLGTPIGFFIRNKDAKSEDYDKIAQAYRPSHADFTYAGKYGFNESAGGGRSSARETVARVVGGALAKIFLAHCNISIVAYVNRIGSISIDNDYSNYVIDNVELSPVRCPDKNASEAMTDLIGEKAKLGDTLGGEITCVIKNVPVGIGEPVFHKLNAELGHAILGINAVKGFEIGSGFRSARMTGSEHNDLFYRENDKIRTKTNNSGGLLGGISNGEDIYFRTAFKPVSTIMKDQKTIDIHGNKVILEGKGRHDVCVVPRAVPIVEAMAALVIADQFLQNKVSKLKDIV